MASTTAVDMSVVCRCCLQKESCLINIFNGIGETSSLNFASLVRNCVGLEIKVGDGLPDHICTACSKEATNFFNFKKMCLKSDELLRPSAVIDLETLKEVACQTDEYHNDSRIPALAGSNSICNAEEGQDSLSMKSVELEDNRDSSPKNENIIYEKETVNQEEKESEVNAEDNITDNVVEKSLYNQSHLNVPNLGSCLKDVAEKTVNVTGNSDTSTLNNASKNVGSFSPVAEVQDSVMDEDIAINTPDLPLSDESIFTVLDIPKEKDADVIEVNELGEVVEKLSSCNSQLSGDFDWLEGNETKEKGAVCNSDVSAPLLNSLLRENDESYGGKSSSSDVVVIEVKVADKKESTGGPLENKIKDISPGEKTLKLDDDDDVVMLEELKSDKTNGSQEVEVIEDIAEVSTCENKMISHDDLEPMSSLEGKLTLKSIEDLTEEKFEKVQTSVEGLESKLTETGSKDDLTLGNLLKVSATRVSDVNAGDSDQSSEMKDRTLGQIIKMSLDKPSIKACKMAQSNEESIGKGSEHALKLGEENVNAVKCSSDVTRKRPRTSEEDGEEVQAAKEGGSNDPSLKRQCVGESTTVGEETEPTVDMGDDDVSVKTDAKGGADGVNKMESGIEVAKANEDIGFEKEDFEQLQNLSDDGIFEEDDSVSDSSGSEYVPADSPARSDDSPRRKRSKNRTRVKLQINKLREQGYNIRECSVVLSDIAHPGSNTVTTTCSVSSHRSSPNDSDCIKEPDDISHHTSTSCTAWIKVEPESTMEGMEEEGLEEGNALEENTLDENEVENAGNEDLEHGDSWPVVSDDVATPSLGVSAETQRTLAKFVSGRKRFLCPFCAKAFRTKNQMMLHRSQHTGDLPYPCEVCGKRFALRCRLLRHMSVHDASINCEFCGMDFKTNILLGKHIKAKHTIPSYSYTQVSPQAQRFPCRMCPKVFSTISGLKVHKRVHMNTPLRIMSSLGEERSQSESNQNAASENRCKICGMVFPNPLYLKSHMVCHSIIRPNSGKVNLIEGSKPPEISEENPRIAGSKIRDEALNVMEPTVVIHESPASFGETPYQHQNQQYSGMNQFICSVCSQIFQSRSQLLRHQTLIHRSLKCEICASMFSSAEEVQSHKLTHHPFNTGQPPTKKHKCTVCGKEFPRRSRLVQHMAVHTAVPGPVSCEVCRKYFANTELLNIHKKCHENGEGMPGTGDLTCGVCHRVFAKRSRLKRHMLLHESQSFPCSKCQKVFISQELLAEHLKSHATEPAEAEEPGVACTACGRMFANRGRLKQHVVVHTRSGFVYCNTCFKVFANNQVLEMHAQTCINTDESSTSSQSANSSKSASSPHPSSFSSCINCSKAFPSKELLTEHEKTCVGLTVVKKLDGTWKVLDSEDRTRVGVKSPQDSNNEPSPDVKVHACKVCNKRFNNYHGLNSHMRFHQESVGIYKCELCNKKFSSRNILSQHMSSHTAVYRCGICSQAFGMVDELKKHVGQCMTAQSGIAPNYFFCNGCTEVFNLLEELAQHVKCHADEFPHVCTECYKVFAHSTQLNRHIATHIKQETSKYNCPVCQKPFNHGGALEKHMVVHTGEKRFQCSYCFQRFSQKSSLNRHQLTQHETKN